MSNNLFYRLPLVRGREEREYDSCSRGKEYRNCFNSFVPAFLPVLLFTVMLLFVSPSATVVFAQSIPIYSIEDEQIRIQQLFRGSTFTSLTSRPLHLDIYLESMKDDSSRTGFWFQPFPPVVYQIPDLPDGKLGLYTPDFTLTHNSSLPYGWNNETSWNGRGFNSRLNAGFWISSPYASFSFRPQFTHQQNLHFEYPRFVPYGNGETEYRSEAIFDQIDRPFRFGNSSYYQISRGYSSIRLHYRQAEAGFSSEPLWWGPSIHYPLLLSNNAPGMQHVFAGTRAPVSIPYTGRIEFRLIGAFPETSNYFENEMNGDEDDESDNPFNLSNNRFMSGVLLTYSPSFAPNLSIGWARLVHTYIDESGLKISDLGMLLDPIRLEQFIAARGPLDQIKPRNHLTSLFLRWIWPESRFELYGEYMRNDFSWDSRDALMQTRHNSAYSLGFQKLILAPGALFYRVNVEFTNLTPSFIQEVRPQNYFYAHPEIREGHTHRGQLLGAAIGPGSNSQMITFDSYQEWGRFGFFFRRLADNNHFHFLFDRSLNRPEVNRQGYGDYWRHRTDLTLGATVLYQRNSVILSSELSWTKLFNYGRFDYGRFGGLNIANFEPYDATNVTLSVGFTYLFNSP